MSLTADAADGKTGYRSSAGACALQTWTVFLLEAKMFASAHLSSAVAASIATATNMNRCGHGRAT